MNTKNIAIYRQLLGRVSANKIRNADFERANFGGVNFWNADFKDTNFWNANFENANFEDADFEGTDFEGADFEGADFKDVTFEGVDFKDVNFENANFKNVIFKDTDFVDADFEGANLKFKGVKKFKYFPNLYKYPSFSFIFENKEPEIRLGCFQRTIKEWKNDFWNNNREFPNNNSNKSNARKKAFEINEKWILENE